jgi:hypothetical protein
MRHIIFILTALSAFSTAALALDADSLGGNPWTSYFRKDVPDTAYGMKWFPDSLVLGTYGTGAVKLPFVTNLFGYNNIGDPLWAQIDLYGDGISVSHQQLATGVYGLHMIEYNPDHVLVQLEAGSLLNTNAHLLRLSGVGYASPRDQISELMKIAEISASGIGMGIYNAADSSVGIYIDQGGSGSAIRIENNDWSTGNGLFIDNNNNGTALRIDDVKGTGRIIYTCQDSARQPAFTALHRGSQSGVSDDSSMFYWWGIKGHKAEVETVKTALCGLRAFGNGNLCDTILVSGVAESTTVVTANYAGGFESATCTPLRIKVEAGAIIVKRGAATDPDRYYWQATLMLGPGQKTDPKPPVPDNGGLGFLVYPNPSSGTATARYSLPRAGRVQLTVYNMLGQKVKTIADGWQPAGAFTVQWDGKNDQGRKAAAGIYLCRIKAAGRQETQKMAVIK